MQRWFVELFNLFKLNNRILWIWFAFFGRGFCRQKIESTNKIPSLPETATIPVCLFLWIVYLMSAPKSLRHTGQRPKNGKKVSALEVLVNPDRVAVRSRLPPVTPVVDPYLDPRTSGIANYNPQLLHQLPFRANTVEHLQQQFPQEMIRRNRGTYEIGKIWLKFAYPNRSGRDPEPPGWHTMGGSRTSVVPGRYSWITSGSLPSYRACYRSPDFCAAPIKPWIFLVAS